MGGYAKEVTVTFELADGRELRCEYSYSVTYGNISGPPEYCYPDESDVGEPTYYLDDNEVTVEQLPKGLEVIAEAMYDNGESDKRFTYSESEVEQDFDDYRDYDGEY